MPLTYPGAHLIGGAGGSITVTGGAGGCDPYAPLVRRLLNRRLAEWDAYVMVPNGYNEAGNEKYKREYTPLGKDILRFRKEYPDIDTVLDLVQLKIVNRYLDIGEHLSRHGLSFGMTREAALAVADAEEKALAERKAADTEFWREQENTAAVLAILRLPWTHAERKRGREVERENVTDHLLTALGAGGYVYETSGIPAAWIRVWRSEDAPERMR